MAVDNLESEYHLTPDGWQRGTETFFGNGQEKPVPSNRIETWRRREYQSSRFSPPEITWRVIWPEGGMPATNKAIRDKFPPPAGDFPK